ncbi:MAG: hypothetical protein AAGH43_07940 [Pseudomonadota bacterium]
MSVNDPARASLLARAFDYPYIRCQSPVLFDRGQFRPLPLIKARARRDGLVEVELGGSGPATLCLPMLALGSNAALSVLRRKFGDRPTCIVQDTVRISDHQVAHSAHIARYGAMPATLTAAAGQQPIVHVQLIPLNLVSRLDRSEAVGVNYERRGLAMRVALTRLQVRLAHVWVYQSRHGPVKTANGPLPLGSQRRALAYAAGRVGWMEPLEAFAIALARDANLRARTTQALKG